jgi:hypothetical protein
MALTVIGGSNFIGRYLIKSLSGAFPEVRLGDMYPSRQSVYRLQEELGDKLKKYPLSFPTNLKLILDGTEKLFIVTHDYFKLAHSKNFYVSKAVEFAQDYNIKEITLINPMELDQLNSWDGDPDVLIRQSEEAARKINPGLKSLRVNLLFGQNCTSLLIHHALESLGRGKSAITYNNGQTKFAPVHEADFLTALQGLKAGESAAIAGPEEMTWAEITNVLAEHCGRGAQKHGGMVDWIKGWSAVCNYTGDILWPSQYQQLYRLLDKNREFKPTITGNSKLSQTYMPGKFQGVPSLNWHRVILD